MQTKRKKLILILTIIVIIIAGFSAISIYKVTVFENAHNWSNGELTSDTVITYTCTDDGCRATKEEKVSKDQVVTTRADLEDALAETALAYYMKGAQVQYDSGALSSISTVYGGTNRLSYEAAPEYGTEDTTIYSVCSDYTYKIYQEALGIKVLGEPNLLSGLSTTLLWRYAENQQQSSYDEVYADGGKESFNDKDVDTALLRWCDFDRYTLTSDIEEENRFGIYDSTAFTDFKQFTESSDDDSLEFKTTGKTVSDAEGNEVAQYAYYLNGKEISADDVKKHVKTYATENNYANLRIGDLLVYDTHAVFYIGNGRIIDCNGAKFDRETGVDKVEKRGILYTLTVESILKSMQTDFIIMRPLEFYATDYDGNPDNDIVNVEIPEKTKSRMEYPGIEIDRTVDITPYGTAVKDEELTYSIKITNNSSDVVYLDWAELSAASKGSKVEYEVKYEDLVVTETIPDGTVIVEDSIVGGGVYDSKTETITWTVDVEASEPTTLSYKVKVTADIGATITNDGGFVASIPSNSISNIVGGAQLDDNKKTALQGVSNAAAWQNGSELAFAKNIYASVGVDLTMPDTVSEVVEKLFEVEEHVPIPYNTFFYSANGSNATVRNMFIRKTTISEGDEGIAKMLIGRYYGGYRFYVGNDNQYQLDSTILEFKKTYLEPGDIIIHATTKDRSELGMSNAFSSVTVMVYDGAKLLVAATDNGTTTYSVYNENDIESKLLEALMNTNDLFFALRPSQSGMLGN